LFDRNSTIKVLVVAILIGVLALSVIGCQQSKTQGINSKANQGQNTQPVISGVAKVMFFSADY
jgi:hypothetical protein